MTGYIEHGGHEGPLVFEDHGEVTVLANEAKYTRLDLSRLGLWLFILSETMLFIGLLATRFVLLERRVDDHVDQVIGLVITAILLVSSLTAYRAETAIAHDDQARLRWNLRATIILGIVFLGGVGYEWYEALQHFPPSSDFGTVFFTMTGMHAFHVLTGIIFLALVAGNARRGAFSSHHYWHVEGAVKYWHFVDVVWVFFYPALYLIG